jgi:hypothetical protein
MNLTQTSPYWPYIRAIGKALTFPGTKIGPGLLVDIQDKLSGDEAQRKHAARGRAAPAAGGGRAR